MAELSWRRSSRSGNGGNTCVEAARAPAGTIAARDSKNPGGPRLTFPVARWEAFLSAVKRGEFDL
jgi:hypothetical protein